MKLSHYLKFSFFILLFSCNQAPEQQLAEELSEALPNIVLLIGDDQGYPYFGFMGADYIQTPNMDQLAASGTLFTNGYVPDNHCRPSLQTLLTGILPIQYKGIRDSIKEDKMKKEEYLSLSQEEKTEWDKNFDFHAMQYFETLPKVLAQKGYASFQGGKWWEYHFENGGFTHGMTLGWTEEERNQPGWFEEFMGGDGTDLARVSNQAAYDFLESTSGSPFFMWYAPSLPHYPFDAPEKYYNLYKDKEMTESAKQYYANCSWFDDAFGQLVEHLKEKDLFDNTLFIYVNDNGWEQNPDQEFVGDEMRYHNGGDKGKLSIYDQSFRSPIIFSWPGKIAPGVVKEDLVHSADIPATILDFLEIPVPDHYFGKSYKGVIEGSASSSRSEILGNVTQIRWEGDMMGKNIEGYWLRNKDWFFQWNATDDQKALFDMNEDPFNDKDLSSEFPDLVAQLQNQIEDWKKTK